MLKTVVLLSAQDFFAFTASIFKFHNIIIIFTVTFDQIKL